MVKVFRLSGQEAPLTTLPAFRTPPRIIIPKVVRSRDAWKAKSEDQVHLRLS